MGFQIRLALLVALAACGPRASWAQSSRSIKLTVGQSEPVTTTDPITKVQVLNPGIADVASTTATSATIVGVGPGTTELLIKTRRRTLKYSVSVTAVEVGRVFKQVRQFLGRIEGIYPRLLGDTVVLSGEALTAEDFGRAHHAAKLFGGQVRNMVRFKPSVVDQVNRLFERTGMTSVRARLVSGTLFIEGAVDSKQDQDKLAALLNAYGLEAENLVRVGSGKQILIDVQFVEMRKRGLNQIGIQWPASVAVTGQGAIAGKIPLVPSGGAKVDLDLASPLTVGQAAVNLLFSSGYARLLAQPKLVCGSGKTAEFLVGGEVPIVAITNNAVNIDFKPFGIKLKVTPIADSLDQVQAEIQAEVSEPDRSLTVLNVPGFRTRRFSTSVAVKNGSSIVLSGLFSNTEEKAVSKFPLLGHIPILGELFKSREFQEQKTTLIVFVTPKVVTPAHPWVQKTIKDIQQGYADFESDVGWQVFD